MYIPKTTVYLLLFGINRNYSKTERSDSIHNHYNIINNRYKNVESGSMRIWENGGCAGHGFVPRMHPRRRKRNNAARTRKQTILQALTCTRAVAVGHGAAAHVVVEQMRWVPRWWRQRLVHGWKSWARSTWDDETTHSADGIWWYWQYCWCVVLDRTCKRQWRSGTNDKLVDVCRRRRGPPPPPPPPFSAPIV